MLNIEKYLTKHSNAGIIINVVKIKFMRVCWNWQTGTFEGRVFYDVRVQVPSLAPRKAIETSSVAFCLS